MTPTPPRLPTVLLRVIVPSERADEVEGDLLELFAARATSHPWRARWRYWQDTLSVIASLRHHPRRHDTSQLRRSPMTTLSNAWHDLRLAVRGLAKRPGYAMVSAATLALGIGANVAIFTVLNAVLLRPLPYPDSSRLVEIRHHAPGIGFPDARSSAGLVSRYRGTTRTLTHVSAYNVRPVNVGGSGPPERVRALLATTDLLNALGTRPALGRGLLDTDAVVNGAPVVIVGDAIWRSRFGGDPAIIGRTIQIDGRATEVIGVMPRGFSFPDPETLLVLPRTLSASEPFGNLGTTSIGRLVPGVTLPAARQEIAQLQQRIPEWFPDMTSTLLQSFGWSSDVVLLQERVVGDVTRALWILFGTVGLVLLIAGANVANLFLVRAESRQREMAVKSALGASRVRIASGFVAESLVLSAAGGAAGLLLAQVGVRLLRAYGPARLPRLHEISIDGTVVVFALALSVLAAVVLGLIPSIGANQRALPLALRDGGRGTTSGRARHRVRQTLIVGQVAIAVVLLIASGLTLRSIVRLNAVDPGIDVDGLTTAAISIGRGVDRERAAAFYHRTIEELSRLPGVTAVGAASTLPILATSMSGTNFEIRSRPQADNAVPTVTMLTAVTDGYFETTGLPIVAGRPPHRLDTEGRLPVAWVNRTLARQFLDDRAVGESIKIGETWLEIVGVVGDVKSFGLQEAVRPLTFLPLSNPAESLDVMHVVVRSSGEAAQLAGPMRGAIDRIDRNVPVTPVRTLEDIVEASLAQNAFTVTVMAIAAAVALLLGVVGLYGVISYIVTQRSAEIGVRLALGAKPAQVRRMVQRQGVVVSAIGVVVGLAVAWLSSRLMAALLFEVSARDPLTFAVVAVLLLVVSLAATYFPARRAAALDPLTAIREA